MGKINNFVITHPDLFKFKKAEEIHAHDKFLNITILRFFPKWVTPNKITLFRIFATPLVFFLILNQNYKWGSLLFLLVAFTDALDGSLARTKGKITDFGTLLDPLADKLLIGSMIILLVFQYYDAMLGLTILFIEITFIIVALVAKIKFKTVRMANTWGKIKMILQVLAVFLTLSGILLGAQQFFTLAAWVFGVAIGFAIISLFAHGV